MHPFAGALLGFSNREHAHEPPLMVCHCLLVETNEGLVLIDTGIGLEDVRQPARRLGRSFMAGVRPSLDPAQTARRQVEALGFSAEDVRHLIVTHLDLDHAGGLADFPRARVHLLATEHDAAIHPATALERQRYAQMQWQHGPTWEVYWPQGEPWFGFEAVRDLRGLPPEILLVPLDGHTRGHAAIAVDTGDSWLLHCGDAYFHRDEIHPDVPGCPRGFKVFETAVAVDRHRMRHNQRRLRMLRIAHDEEVRVFCAHDPVELERLGGHA